MKTNIFKLSFVTLAVTAFMASCTQNEEISSAVEGNVTLEVNATVQDFVPDASTRVVDEVDSNNEGNYITKFEEGDEIGVYVFTEDGTMMCKNLPMTYNAEGKWISETPLYFYKNATYIAYSPYNPEVSSLQIVGSGDVVEAITDYFVGTVMNEPSKTYKDCDLMTASAVTNGELPASGTSAITFNFAHAMSMVEFVIPVKNYKTASGYEYSAPIFGVKLQKQENTGAKVDITPLALGKGVYRTLLAPVAADIMDKDLFFHGELMVGDGTQPVYFSTENAFKPVAGTFKKVIVTYEGAPSSEVETRDLQIGDYFYADGGIVPVETEVTEVPKKNLVGLIFSLSTSAEDQAHGWKQGYVVAIKKVSTKWGATVSSEYLDVDDAEAKAAFIANMNGYDMTVAIKEVQGGTGDNISTALSNFESRLTVETVSGWYCPSPGQLISILENLGGYNPGEDEDYFTHNSNRIPSVTTLNNKMQTIVGDNSSDFSEFTWSAAEASDSNAWSLQCKTWGGSSAYVSISDSRPKNKPYDLRPVLAF